MRVLVTGGAGYVGSAVVAELLAGGASPIVIDDLSAGHREAVPRGVPLVEARIQDQDRLKEVLQEHSVEAIVHMAASCLVGESMENPALYFENNVSAGLTLLEGMRACGIRRIVFSSSAATYGQPASTPIREDDPVRPVNPYGETKGMFEAALRWYHEAYGLQYVSLRYFNAAGATPEVGEDHDPETHLIPLVLRVALGQATAITIYGDDYPSTPDGTCVRDFVHVKDIARAHSVALATLERCSGTFNLGTGEGCSVRQVIDMAQNVTGHRIPAESGPRRAGDPEVLVACADRAEKDLGWKPEMSDLDTILEDAWTWHRAHPDGYGHD